jgi:hypothetical protein
MRNNQGRAPFGNWPTQFPASSEIFLRNSHQNSHSREKKKTAFWGGL